MNFQQALKLLLAGKKIKYDGLVIEMDGGSLIETVSGEILEINNDLVDFVGFQEESSLGVNAIYAFFNTEKNRWVSTTEPAKHKAAGKKVAVFDLAEEI